MIGYIECDANSWEGMPLIPGETVYAGLEKDITYQCPVNGPTMGKLLVTNYKLYFYGPCPEKANKQLVIQVPLGTVSHIEKIGGTNSRGNDSRSVYGFNVFCKDLRILHFILKHESKQRKSFLEKVNKYCFPVSNQLQFFAYSFKEVFDCKDWDVYNPETEYKRQGLPTEEWRFTDINNNYELCDTYPKFLVVPAKASNDDLYQVAQFRSRARIPVLSWIHPSNKATITRCAQPLVGISSKRSKEDEKYLTVIWETNKRGQKLPIYDARPQANAIANVARGGGYEKSENYINTDLVFCDIHNIHVMRDSLKKVQEAFSANDEKRWYSVLEQTEWLQHAKTILAAATRIANLVENEKVSVLVHCSDGWDRTAQMTGLAMIMLDSYYRTIKGFEVLIEKEWLSFGHKFAQRIGHGDKNYSDSERSPVFLQFIDCVWQLTQQFPTAFEFNEDFLVFILDHLYSCLFGNFLYNCEKERMINDIKNQTKSLWSLVNSCEEMYKNPMYVSTFKSRVLLPVAALRVLSFWNSYYGRWNPKFNLNRKAFNQHKQLLYIRNQLKNKVEELENRASSNKN